jgi:MFS family permease
MRDRVNSVVGALIGMLAINILYFHVKVGHALFGIRMSHIGLEVLSAVSIGAGLISLVVTAVVLLPRLGPRLMFVIGGWIAGVGFGLASLALHAERYELLYLASVFLGAGMGMTLVLPLFVLVRWFENRAGLWIGIAFSVASIGVYMFSIAGPLVSGDWIENLVWDLALMGAAAIVLLNAAGWLVRLPPVAEATSEEDSNASVRINYGPALGTILRSGWFWVLFGALCLTEIATRWHLFHNLTTLSAISAEIDYSFSFDSSDFSLVQLAAFAVSPLLFGLLADRLGRLLPMFVASLGLIAIVFLRVLSPSVVTVYLSYYGFDVLGGGLELLGVALAVSVFGAVNYPRVCAFGFVFTTIGSVAILYLHSWSLGSTQKWIAAVVAYALLAVLALVGWRIAGSNRKRRSPLPTP